MTFFNDISLKIIFITTQSNQKRQKTFWMEIRWMMNRLCINTYIRNNAITNRINHIVQQLRVRIFFIKFSPNDEWRSWYDYDSISHNMLAARTLACFSIEWLVLFCVSHIRVSYGFYNYCLVTNWSKSHIQFCGRVFFPSRIYNRLESSFHLIFVRCLGVA